MIQRTAWDVSHDDDDYESGQTILLSLVRSPMKRIINQLSLSLKNEGRR